MSSTMKKRYLFSSAAAVAAAFISINIYPEQHGMGASPTITRLVVSSAILSLFIYILFNVYLKKEHPDNHDDNELQKADLQRQKKMFVIWSLFTVILCIPLIKNPIEAISANNFSINLKNMFSLFSGSILTIYSVLNIIIHYKNK